MLKESISAPCGILTSLADIAAGTVVVVLKCLITPLNLPTFSTHRKRAMRERIFLIV